MAITTLFAIARRSRPSARWEVAQLVVTVLATTAAIVSIERVLIGAGTSGLDPVVTGVIVLVWIGFLTLLSSAVLIALRTRGTMREELERLLDDGLGFDLEDASRRLRDRETADLLHSGTQNRLIAAARRIESSGSRTDVVRDEIAEAVNNAVRHGRAEQVQVRLVAGEGSPLRLEVEDDGIGPVGRPAGLGSRLFHALSLGAWELAAREEGGSRLVVPIAQDDA